MGTYNKILINVNAMKRNLIEFYIQGEIKNKLETIFIIYVYICINKENRTIM